jgi:hypothetical protein
MNWLNTVELLATCSRFEEISIGRLDRIARDLQMEEYDAEEQVETLLYQRMRLLGLKGEVGFRPTGKTQAIILIKL